MIAFPGTIWTIVWANDSRWIVQAGQVLRYCATVMKPERMILFTHNAVALKAYPFDVIRIPELNWQSYNIFLNRVIPMYIQSEFAMSVHYDGFPIDESLWRSEFLDWDYIGATWNDGVVGNGGFCIESRKLLELKPAMPMDRSDFETPSDRLVCGVRRAWLEERGVRFAPPDLALQFSTEQVGGENPSFGFHGRAVSAEKFRKGWGRIRAATAVPDRFTQIRNRVVPAAR